MALTRTRSDRRPTAARRSIGRLAALAAVLLSVSAGAQDDPLTPYRGRFQQGLDRFRAGDVHGAIQYWEPIRRELGDAQAYRLLFNLGKAYETLGDATIAAERFESFLQLAAEAEKRGPLADTVRENLAEATTRLAEIRRTRGLIRVAASERPGLVQIDLGEPRMGAFRAFIAPGDHTVTIDRGTPLERTLKVSVTAGQEIVVDPTRPAPAPAPSSSAPSQPATSAAAPAPAPPTMHPIRVVEPPFSANWIVAASALTAVSLVAPWLVWRRARRLGDQYDDPTITAAQRRELYDDYQAARSAYAWSWAVPALFATGTGALTAWYFTGGKERIEWRAAPQQGGAWVGLHGHW